MKTLLNWHRLTKSLTRGCALWRPGWRRLGLHLLALVALLAGTNAHAQAPSPPQGELVSWSHGTIRSDVPPGSDFVASAGALRHYLALRSDGTLVAWGDDVNETVSGVPSGNNFIDIATGYCVSIALRTDGSIAVWGNAPFAPGENTGTYTAIAAGAAHALALRTDGSLVGWGGGNEGESVPPAGNDFVALGASQHASFPVAIKAVPVAIAGANQTVHCTGPNGAMVTLDGSASYDPDGRDLLQYEWSPAENSGVVLANPNAASTTGVFPIGVHQVTLTVYDIDEFGVRKGGVGVVSVTIVVVDDEPPVALVTTDKPSLWPANGAMVPVTVSVQASDLCSDPDDLVLLCTVSSNQADSTNGNGQWTGDVDGHDGYSTPVEITLENVGDGLYQALIYLRAERDPSAMSGRVYSINLAVMDGAGNFGNATTTVVVPHDGKKN